MNKEKNNTQGYLLEKVGECVAGIQFLKWMFGIFVLIVIFLFGLVFQFDNTPYFVYFKTYMAT